MKPKIYLSPSNQKLNIYPNGSNELRICNKITDEIVKYLNFYNVKVYRNSYVNNYMTNINQSNRLKCDTHICIHTNIGNENGCEVWYQNGENKDNKIKKESKKLAEMFQNAIVKNLKREDRGIKYQLGTSKNDYFCELSNANMPSVIIEIEFHDNIDNANWLCDNINKIAMVLSEVIIEYHKLELKNNNDIGNNSQIEHEEVIKNEVSS